jgi:protein O-mannosyl-transferase
MFCKAHFCNAAIIPLALLLAVLAAYGNALHGAFQFDDYNVIVNSGVVHSWAAWHADVAHGLRPLLKLSYTLNWVYGPDVLGFHLFNIGVHFLNVLLIYALASRLFERSSGNDPQRKRWAALFAALLFAVHPANTEAITYISGRSMSLMTLFYLAAFLAYIKGREENKAMWLYAVSPALFILAVAAKETAVTLPFALLLWEVCYVPMASPGNILRNVLRRQGVHWCVFLLLALLLFFNDRYWRLMAFSAGLHSVQENFLTQLHALTYLLGQLLLPWRSNIDPDLPIMTTWNQVWLDGLLWSILLVAAMWNLRKRPWLSFALGWFVLQLFPLYVFLPRLDVANDRHLYLAGWVMLLPVAVVCAGRLADIRLRNTMATALVLALAGLTLLRNEVYRSEVALWEDTVRNSPHKARPYNNLGYAYFLAGDRPQAEQAYLTAVKLNPGYWLAENNLAQLRNSTKTISAPEE